MGRGQVLETGPTVDAAWALAAHHPHFFPERGRRGHVEHRLRARLSDDHDPIFRVRRADRDLGLPDVNTHVFGISLERIAPSAAAGGSDPYHLALAEGDIVLEPAELFVSALAIDGDAEWLAGAPAAKASAP